MIYRRALLADHVEFVDPAEGYVVRGEETLYRFLCRLLVMKKCPLRVWRFSSKEYLNSPQILRSPGEPRSCIHGSDRIKRHAEASLL